MSEVENNKEIESIIIECPNKNCGCKLKIPKTDKKLSITCPRCEVTFLYPFQYSEEKIPSKQPSWLIRKIKDHPIFFGLMITICFVILANRYLMNTLFLEDIVRVIGTGLVIWLMGTWILDRFNEPDIKWYYRKWFVLLSLFFLPPLGITLLWAGSKFSKFSKVILTIFFGSWFVINFFTTEPRDFLISPQDYIAELFSNQKEESYLKPASYQHQQNFKEFILNTSSPLTSTLTGTQIYNRWNESIVVLLSVDEKDNVLGQGSGFIISPDGAVATNYHVISSAYKIFIRFVSGKTYQDTSLIIGFPKYDIAILKIEENESFEHVFLGDSDDVQIGEPVLAIGSPYGLENTVSNGIISGKREIGDITLLQITAPVSSGSSGGALFNMKGEIIGITSIGSQWNAQNLNFAIPINILKNLISENL
jgi:S1-C subfamily serine protease